MGVKFAYYIADFMTGDMVDVLPLEDVSLSSGILPGQFRAQLDLRKTGMSKQGCRDLLASLSNGKRTLVPVIEGLSTGAGNVPSSLARGEWWISDIDASYRSPIVTLSGPEFAGYTEHALTAVDRVGNLDQYVAARALLGDLFNTGQTVAVDRGTWTSPRVVNMNIRAHQQSYWQALEDIGANGEAPTGFEWLIRAGLRLTGWSPTSVSRSLVLGYPTIANVHPSIALDITAPGLPVASVLDAQWSRSEAASASDVYAWGAGHGDDQIGPVAASRAREAGEPVKSRLVSDPTARNTEILARAARRGRARFTPESRELTARMSSRFTPRPGEVYQWNADASWTRQAESSDVRCVAWSWQSSDPDFYDLDLERV